LEPDHRTDCYISIMKLKRRGLIATIVYHALLLLLLLFAGLTYPDPPPEEEGILVNFGTDETGLGDYEPMGDDQQAGNPDMEVTQSQQPVEEVKDIPEPVQERVQESKPPDSKPVDQTQDVEETRVKEKPKPTAEELERQRQQELERQRQTELEKQRIEQERIEREKREEQERIERERQQQAERLNNLGRNAFGNQGVGQTEGSEGITQGDGNQGDPNGSPDADNYSTGGGLGNNPYSYGLGSRKARGTWPLPNMSGCDVTQKIEVTVEIQVDRDGNVIGAEVSKATYQNKCIWDMVVDAAMRSKFSADQAAAFRQTGWIRYIIVP
jgi:colicin import membrane protein